MPHLFRIHIRPKGGNPDMHATFQHCLENRVLGVGWRVDGLANTQDWAEYEQVADPVHDSIAQPRYIATHVCPGALVWTRDPHARYYLARVRSGWEYWTSPEAAAMDIDIANIFRCEDFREVELDRVPGTVVSIFGLRGRSIQRIADRSALVYSQHLWNRYVDEPVYDVDRAQFPDIFAMLDAEETEDLVFMYLQSRGWYVVPNSRKGNTMRFEFMLACSRTGEKALVQVKTGKTPLDIDSYVDDRWRIFLFQSNELYEGEPVDKVTCLRRDALKAFLLDRIDLFPRSFRTKLRILGDGRVPDSSI